MREEAEAIMKELKSLHEKINSITVADERCSSAEISGRNLPEND